MLEPMNPQSTRVLIDTAMPLLDAIRAQLAPLTKAGTSPDKIAGSVIASAIQTVIMAEFSQLGGTESQRGEVAGMEVEMTMDKLHTRFYGAGQGLGVTMANVIGDPAATAIIMNSTMMGLAEA